MTDETATATQDRGPLTVDPADLDRRTARTVVRADLRERSKDRELDRAVRSRKDRRDRQREDRAAKTQDRRDRRTRRRQDRAAKTARRTAWAGRQISYARANAPAVYSTAIYGASIAVAVGGQITAATDRGWPAIVGLGIAVFVEGMAMTNALTAHQLRMQGERALVPRILTWVCALFAAGVNFIAHDADPVLAVILAASSLAGITVWEIRSGARNRPELRRLGLIPQPSERFGWRRWLRYLPSTFAAWSLDIHVRVTPRAAGLLAEVDRRRTVRRQDRDRTKVLRSARFAVRASAVLRGPSDALTVLRTAADLLAETAVPTVPDRGAITVPPVLAAPPVPVLDRAAPGPHPTGPPVPPDGPGTAAPAPVRDRGNVRAITAAGSDERFLALVRNAYPEEAPTWKEVREVLDANLEAMGLKPSKDRVKRVRHKLLAERGLADDLEDELAVAR